tara:strand:+ start:2286 stop:2624 length:339 start_codon:yes stop_codon:yes gene_type:complete
MSNIIQFPIEKRRKQLAEEEDIFSLFVEEAEELTQFIVDEIDSLPKEVWPDVLDDFDFRDPKNPEARDMYVITNLINSMFLRYLGIKHNLHSELDKTYEHIMEMQKRNNDTT